MKYSTGTVAVTNNTYVVVGTGTTWSSLSLPLLFGVPGGGVYECSRIVDDTTLWLSELYTGETATGAEYILSDPSFTPLYNLPITTTTDLRKADTITAFLLAVERTIVSLYGGEVVTGIREQPYSIGLALFGEGEVLVKGYGTEWDTLSLTPASSGGTGATTAYIPEGFIPEGMFPGGYWPLPTEVEEGPTDIDYVRSTGYDLVRSTGDAQVMRDGSVSPELAYIKKEGEETVYQIHLVESATSLYLTSSYTDELNVVVPYEDGTTYYFGSMVSFDGDVWVLNYSPSVTDIPPISTYSSTGLYSAGNIVLELGRRYTFIGEDSTSGIAPPNEAYWRETVDTDYLTTNTYWSLFRGSPYQIIYKLTENYYLPLLTEGVRGRWSWFGKAVELLDVVLAAPT